MPKSASTHRAQLLQMITALGGDERELVYLSVPITSGIRHFEHLSSAEAGSKSEWCATVKQANISEARQLATRLRDSRPTDLILNPAELEMRNWTQDDYNAFWLDVIASYANEVVASPGWAWSNGARFEIAAAVHYSIPVTDIDGHPRTRSGLIKEAHAASEEVQKRFGVGKDGRELLVAFDVGHIPIQPSAQTQAFDWLQLERSYQLKKFGTALDDRHTVQGIGIDSWWQQQLDNYLHRARTLGLEIPNGRQALAKFTATAVGMLESVVRVHGPLPDAGVSSGEVRFAEEARDVKIGT